LSTASARIGPLVSLELLRELDALYPERCADLKDSDREVWAKAGERRVLQFMRAAFDEANENILQGPSS
jgi:hypothetical protein